MNDAIDEKKQALIQVINELPERYQSAVAWLIENHDYAVSICKAGALSEERRERLLEKAIADDEPLMIALLSFERCVNGNEKLTQS